MMWFKATTLIAVTTLIGACHVGPQLDQTGIGRQPHGANVTVEITRKNEHKRTKHDGELVDVRDDGLLIAIRSDANDDPRMAFVPWNIIYGAKATDWSGFAMRSSYGETRRAESIEKLRTISRFPQGLSPELLGQLLAHSGQTTVDTIE
jgi:hypothetical protein